MTACLIDTVVDEFEFDFDTITLEEDIMSALLTAAAARELLEARKQEALASVNPFIDSANEAIQAAVRRDKSEIAMSLESIPEVARPLAIKQLEEAGYLCLANESLSAVKVRF